MAYICQASPLTKLFLRKHQKACQENPDFVFDTTPFDVLIPRATGAITLTHNKPVRIHSVLPKTPGRKIDEYTVGEIENLMQWLTGGPEGDRSEETDVYGVVELKMDLDISGAVVEMAQSIDEGDEAKAEAKKKVEKEYQKLQKTLIDQAKDSLVGARKLADERVKRALRMTHTNLMRQYEIMKQSGLGVYSPSVAEAVGAHILAAEIEKANESNRAMVNRLSDIMKTATIM